MIFGPSKISRFSEIKFSSSRMMNERARILNLLCVSMLTFGLPKNGQTVGKIDENHGVKDLRLGSDRSGATNCGMYLKT